MISRVSSPSADSPTATVRAGFAPVSPAQEQLWALVQKFPDRPLGNFPIALNIDGALDAAALGRALNDVVARHDILRTSFEFVQGRPLQQVAPALNVPLPVVDLRLLPPGVREAQAFRLAREDSLRVFDAHRVPLLRTQLFLLDQNRHILVLTLHRGMFDQESLGLFLRELATCYEARRTGTTPALAPLARQYADYAHEAGTPPAGEAARAWWLEQFAGDPVLLRLPADRPRSGTRPPGGRVEKLELSANLRCSVEILAHREGTNPFTIFLAAFQVLLHRYTNVADFMMGLGASDRHVAGTENLLGPCTRVVPCRALLSGDPTFRDLLERVRSTVLAINAHVAHLTPESLPGRCRNPALACPVQFFYQRHEVELVRWPGLHLQELELDAGAVPCELAFHLVESTAGWQVRAEYDADIFSPTLIQQLLAHFNALLQSAVARPAARLSELPLLTPGERRRLLSEWNSTLVAYPRDATVSELVSLRANAEPDAVAVAGAGMQLTYREVDQRSNQLGRHLRAAGIRPGRLVGLALDRSPQLLVALLGVLKAGGAACLFDPSQTLTAPLLANARLSLIVSQAARRDPCFADSHRVLLLDAEAADIHRADDSTLAAVAGPDDFAQLVFTTGTSGDAKPVELSHRALVSLLYARQRIGGVNPADSVFSASPLGGADALAESLLPLVFGARLELASVADLTTAAALAARLTRCQPTLVQAPPSVWNALLSAGWTGDPALRLICSGEPLTRELADRLLPHGRELWNIYGAAETGGGCLAARIAAGSAQPLLGRPLGNMQVHVLDAHLQPVPIGIAGEVLVGGDALATGYRDEPAETMARFVIDPFRRMPGARLFRTGDLARRLPSGEIEFIGRADGRAARRPFPLPAAPARAPRRPRPKSAAKVPSNPPVESAPVVAAAGATAAASALAPSVS
jgi:non-ribosomal peptide synthetase component F